MANDLVRGTNLHTNFDIGGRIANKIAVRIDGTTIVEDATSGVLSAVAPPADNFIQSGTAAAGDSTAVPPTTASLTLVDGNATTPDVVIDLTPILGVSTETPQLLTVGPDGKPRLDPTAIPNQPVSADAGNLLINGTDGRAMLNPAAIPTQGVSADTGNLLAAGTDGLPLLTAASLCAAIDASCVADSTDVFGAIIPNLRTF